MVRRWRSPRVSPTYPMCATYPLECSCWPLRSSAQKTTTLDTDSCKNRVNSLEGHEINRGPPTKVRKPSTPKPYSHNSRHFSIQRGTSSRPSGLLTCKPKQLPTPKPLEPQRSSIKMLSVSLHFLSKVNEKYFCDHSSLRTVRSGIRSVTYCIPGHKAVALLLDWILLYHSAVRPEADEHAKAVIRQVTTISPQKNTLASQGVDLVSGVSSKLQAAQEIFDYGTYRFITVFTTANHSYLF